MENALSPYVIVLDLGVQRSSCEQDRSDRTLYRRPQTLILLGVCFSERFPQRRRINVFGQARH